MSRRRTGPTTATTTTPSRTSGTSRPPQVPHLLGPLLAQMVAAMQAAVAGLPALGPGLAPPPPRVKISPIFKGLPGERPEAHLLRANDWILRIYYQSTNLLILSTPLTTWLESGMIH